MFDAARLTQILRDKYPEAQFEQSTLATQLEQTQVYIQERYADFPVEQEAYFAFIAERADSMPTLGKLHLGDLFFAWHLAQGLEKAIELFKKKYLVDAVKGLGHMQLDGSTLDEVKQRLLEKLLVADGERVAKITQYSGQGELRRWVGVVALREATDVLRLRSRQPTTTSDEALESMALPIEDPSLAYFRKVYQEEFKQAFQEVFAGLTSKERIMLRQYFLDELTIDQLGSLYGVHRSTTARWLQKTRDHLQKGILRSFQQRHNVSRSGVESIIRMINSRMDISVRQLLTSQVRNSQDETES